MSPTGKFTLRLVIYGAFLLYLVGDLFVWHGFLAGRMDAYLKPLPGPPGDNSARIAEVYGEPVTANQLSRRITELKLLRQPPVLDMEGGIKLTHEPDIPDMLFVDPEYTRRGVACALLKPLIKSESELTVDASITAKPFFERYGFQTVKQQRVERNQRLCPCERDAGISTARSGSSPPV